METLCLQADSFREAERFQSANNLFWQSRRQNPSLALPRQGFHLERTGSEPNAKIKKGESPEWPRSVMGLVTTFNNRIQQSNIFHGEPARSVETLNFALGICCLAYRWNCRSSVFIHIWKHDNDFAGCRSNARSRVRKRRVSRNNQWKQRHPGSRKEHQKEQLMFDLWMISVCKRCLEIRSRMRPGYHR